MKIVLRIAVLLVAVLCMNWLYKGTMLIRYADDAADQLYHMHKSYNADVLYFSESSNFSKFPGDEQDPRRISMFIGDFFPAQQVQHMNKPASHAGIYLDLLDLIPEEAELKVLVVTMNLRSFGAGWIHSTLETSLQQQAVFYNTRPPLLNRFLVSLNYFDNAPPAEREKQMLAQWASDPLPYPFPHDNVQNWCAEDKWGGYTPARSLADQYVKQYAFVIGENNPRIQDFDAIVEWAEERDVHLVFNILAENMEWADSLIGTDLTDLMKGNRDFLVARYEGMGVPVVDNLEKVPARFFVDKDFPTEHYNDIGRKIIAANVSEKLKLFFAEDYKKPGWLGPLQNTLTNDHKRSTASR